MKKLLAILLVFCFSCKKETIGQVNKTDKTTIEYGVSISKNTDFTLMLSIT